MHHSEVAQRNGVEVLNYDFAELSRLDLVDLVHERVNSVYLLEAGEVESVGDERILHAPLVGDADRHNLDLEPLLLERVVEVDQVLHRGFGARLEVVSARLVEAHVLEKGRKLVLLNHVVQQGAVDVLSRLLLGGGAEVVSERQNSDGVEPLADKSVGDVPVEVSEDES